jgi:hypothetical protein
MSGMWRWSLLCCYVAYSFIFFSSGFMLTVKMSAISADLALVIKIKFTIVLRLSCAMWLQPSAAKLGSQNVGGDLARCTTSSDRN